MPMTDGNRKQRRYARKTAATDRRQYERTRQHVLQRQGDEIACSCGLRWPAGESHP